MRMRARKIPRQCVGFLIFLDVLKLCVPSTSRLPGPYLEQTASRKPVGAQRKHPSREM